MPTRRHDYIHVRSRGKGKKFLFRLFSTKYDSYTTTSDSKSELTFDWLISRVERCLPSVLDFAVLLWDMNDALKAAKKEGLLNKPWRRDRRGKEQDAPATPVVGYFAAQLEAQERFMDAINTPLWEYLNELTVIQLQYAKEIGICPPKTDSK